MPQADSGYASPTHSPNCTCVECTRKRLEAFRRSRGELADSRERGILLPSSRDRGTLSKVFGYTRALGRAVGQVIVAVAILVEVGLTAGWTIGRVILVVAFIGGLSLSTFLLAVHILHGASFANGFRMTANDYRVFAQCPTKISVHVEWAKRTPWEVLTGTPELLDEADLQSVCNTTSR